MAHRAKGKIWKLKGITILKLSKKCRAVAGDDTDMFVGRAGTRSQFGDQFSALVPAILVYRRKPGF